MQDDPEILFASGQKALGAGDWASAKDFFEAGLAHGETPEGLRGLAEASWWLGDLDGALVNFERAYAAFRRRPDPPRAVEMALRNALQSHAYLGNRNATDGWLARAARLIDEHDLDHLRGELLVVQAFCDEDPVLAESRAGEALERARNTADPDLELCALSGLGAAQVKQGRVEEGLDLLNESMAAALAGEGTRLETAVFTSCDMLTACSKCAAFERAVQCIRAARRFARRYGCPFLYSECRSIYGEVLFATGEWEEAEKQLEKSIAVSRGSVPVYRAWARAALAEMRLGQGLIEEAEELLAGFEGFGVTAPVQARLAMIRRDFAFADAILHRRLEAIGEDQIESVRLLELLGEAEIARGEYGPAAERARAIAEFGAARSCRVAQARGERLLGQALAAAGADRYSRHFDVALTAFNELSMVFEEARTRLMLALAHGEAEAEVAQREAQLALTTFDQIGASREADFAADLLRKLGTRGARRLSRGLDPLTKREQEVFALLGHGLSNPEIGRRLFISRKTVEHHVGHILDKLGLKSRAEAAAEAVRISEDFAKK